VLRGTFDTVLQNPPFGIQKRKADRRFLVKALEVGKRIYSLHKSSKEKLELARNFSKRDSYLESATPSPFLERFIVEHGGKVTAVYRMLMTIPRIFRFHTKRRHKFLVDLYVIETRKTGNYHN